MTTSDEFYTLSHQDQRRLVSENRVIAGNKLLSEVPAPGTPVRILERPLEERIFNILEQEHHTIRSIAEEFKVDHQSVRRIIDRYRHSHKGDLILDRSGILRMKGYQKQWGVYTIESIPYHVRVADITFLGAFFEKSLEELPQLTPNIDAGVVTDLDEDYATVIGDYWEIDSEEALEYLTSYDRYYVETSILPLPVLDAPSRYDAVVDRLQETDQFYKRRNLDSQTVDSQASRIYSVPMGSEPGLLYFQTSALELFDLHLCAQQEYTALLPEIRQHIESLIARLSPPDETESDDEYVAETPLEDELQIVLQEEPATISELITRLPPHLEQTSTEEAREILNQFARLGLVEKVEDTEPPRYAEKGDPWT